MSALKCGNKYAFRTLGITAPPTNVANQVKVVHALDQLCSLNSRGPRRAHLNNELPWQSSRTFEVILSELSHRILINVGTKHIEWFFDTDMSVEPQTHSA